MTKDKILDKETKEAINFCISKDIMASYLQKFKDEVIGMLKTEYSVEMEIEGIIEEVYKEVREDVREEVYEEVHEKVLKEGELKHKKEVALTLINLNYPIKQIKFISGLPIKEIKKLNGKKPD
jgi:hypothetical protein